MWKSVVLIAVLLGCSTGVAENDDDAGGPEVGADMAVDG